MDGRPVSGGRSVKGLGVKAPLRSVVPVLSIFAVLLCSGISWAGDSDVSMHEGSISVIAIDQPLSRVMAQVAAASGIAVDVSPEADKPVSLSISNRTLESALEQIAREHALNMITGWKKSASGASAIETVMFLPASGPDQGPALVQESGVHWERKARQQFNKDKAQSKREEKRLEREARRSGRL